MRHGPHHDAQKSMSTSSAPPTTSVKFSFVNSVVAISTSVGCLVVSETPAVPQVFRRGGAGGAPRPTACVLAGSWPTHPLFLTMKFFGETLTTVLDVTVIEDPAAAAVSLDPVRARLLAELT